MINSHQFLLKRFEEFPNLQFFSNQGMKNPECFDVRESQETADHSSSTPSHRKLLLDLTYLGSETLRNIIGSSTLSLVQLKIPACDLIRLSSLTFPRLQALEIGNVPDRMELPKDFDCPNLKMVALSGWLRFTVPANLPPSLQQLRLVKAEEYTVNHPNYQGASLLRKGLELDSLKKVYPR